MVKVGHVAAGPVEAWHEAGPDGIAARHEHQRCCCRDGLGDVHPDAVGDDHGDLPPNEVGRQRSQSVILIVGPAIVDDDVLALDESGFRQSLPKRIDQMRGAGGRSATQETHHRQRRLLRACRERPCGRAAKQCDELASSWVEHGLLPGTRRASLPQAQDAPEAPAGPWGGPELF